MSTQDERNIVRVEQQLPTRVTVEGDKLFSVKVDGAVPNGIVEITEADRVIIKEDVIKVIAIGFIGKEAVAITPEKGEPGNKGDMPNHRWVGTKLQFQNPNGSWGPLIDLRGDSGEGGSGGDGDLHYTHNQVVPAQTWVVNHDLGKHVTPICVTTAGDQIIGDVVNTSPLQLIIYWGAPYAGKAFCN